MGKTLRYTVAAALVAAVGVLASGDAALAAGKPKKDALTLTSADLKDNGIIQTSMANSGPASSGGECGGQNISPQFSWKNAPAATKSFALTMYDPDGAGAMGVSHWVAYDIPATKHSVARGEMSKAGQYVGGKNTRGMTTWMGPCPPAGDPWHHYTIQLFALDVAPGQLGADLTRDEFLAKVKGKVLAEASLVGRYTR
jgi:hypothetical protein